MYELGIGFMNGLREGLETRRSQREAMEKALGIGLIYPQDLRLKPWPTTACESCGARQTEETRGRRRCAYCGNDR